MPIRSSARRGKQPKRKARARSARKERSFDIVLMSDITIAGDLDLRIAQQARCYANAGYSVGLLHAPSRWSSPHAAAEVQSCLLDRVADVVDLSEQAKAKLLLIHSPEAISALPDRFRSIHIDRTLVIQSCIPGSDLESREWLLASFFGELSWAPTNKWIREALTAKHPAGRIESMDWRPIGDVQRIPPRTGDRAVTVGWLLDVPGDASPGAARNPAYRQCVFGAAAGGVSSDAWPTLDLNLIPARKVLNRIDVLAYFPTSEAPELPDATLVQAMALGKAVVTTTPLRQQYGKGPIYCPVEDREAAIEKVSLAEQLAAARRASTRCARERFSAEFHLEALARLIGPPRALPSQMGRAPTRRRAVFVASDGDGLAHVTRSLAIARRLHDRADVAFVTTAQAADVIESCGYTAEYIPSSLDTETDPAIWDAWFGVELRTLLESINPSLIVFDGSQPTNGLVRAAGGLSGCRLAWIRERTANENVGPSASHDNSWYADLVIEPGELADVNDEITITTSPWRSGTTAVQPVHLVDGNELLSREAAAAALGLDAKKPAALLHLEPGTGRRTLSVTERALTELQQFSDLQIAVLEAYGLPTSLWPEVVTVHGYPVSQYHRAFDFSIRSADYNTFHEVIAHELPTIFVADDPSTTDYRRAMSAEKLGVGLCLREGGSLLLAEMIKALMSEPARAYIRQNCRRIRRENGAYEAANALAALAGL